MLLRCGDASLCSHPALRARCRLHTRRSKLHAGRRTFTHAALQDAADETRSAVSIDDLRSRELTGVTQVITRPDLGLTIGVALRTARAQRTDVIGCEVRDYETAEGCARAAMEGSVVVGRVPSGNAVTALQRLLDMGLETFVILEAISLVRRPRLRGAKAESEPSSRCCRHLLRCEL